MNKYREALKIVSMFNVSEEWIKKHTAEEDIHGVEEEVEKIEACDILSQALNELEAYKEKDIAKAVDYKTSIYHSPLAKTLYDCPCCGREESINYTYKYCPYCGGKLSWEEK